MMRLTYFVAASLLALAGCARSPTDMERVAVAPDGKSFITSPSNKPFTPRGFNYDRDYKMRLIEEYWDAEWDTVVSDFREMKALGANTIRIHLQFPRFMSAPDKPNDHSLAQLRKLLKLAEDERLYLDLTGLACYRRADVPDWYADSGERSRWSAQANFWSTIAQTCKDSPAVFCYNLVNEPSVPAKARKPRDWLHGDLAGFTYCQFITLDPAGRDRTDLARQWVDQMTAAIRKHDPKTPITVGLLPFPQGTGFDAAALARHLDFISVHFYPESAKLDDQVESLKRFAVGKPLLVEEVFPINCTSDELNRFMERSTFVTGWISFYWGRTPEELEKTGTMADALQAQWLKKWSAARMAQ
jgi:hypothetical protein